jgi:hypothetical protein
MLALLPPEGDRGVCGSGCRGAGGGWFTLCVRLRSGPVEGPLLGLFAGTARRIEHRPQLCVYTKSPLLAVTATL